MACLVDSYGDPTTMSFTTPTMVQVWMSFQCHDFSYRIFQLHILCSRFVYDHSPFDRWAHPSRKIPALRDYFQSTVLPYSGVIQPIRQTDRKSGVFSFPVKASEICSGNPERRCCWIQLYPRCRPRCYQFVSHNIEMIVDLRGSASYSGRSIHPGYTRQACFG